MARVSIILPPARRYCRTGASSRPRREMLVNWHEAGMSVMEMSHRGKEFVAIAAEAEADLRKLAAIPKNYKVLFLQGGATMHFSAVPMNLLRGRKKADYLNTGEWAKKAMAEAKKFCEVNVVASSEDHNFTYAPKQSTWKRSPDAAYIHVCTNETIGGVEFNWVPDTGSVPLVADMSSHILSRPVDVAKYGLIYAGAQKNIGPAGLVVVIVREDLLGHAMGDTPNVLDYKLMAESDSMLNTPPTFSLYLAGLTFKWLLERGGLAEMEKTNIRKAKLLYDYMDGQDFYANPVAKEDRSLMNVPFHPARRQARRRVPAGSRGARALAAEGPPLGGRHARVDLQRDAGGRRRGARRLYGRVSRRARLKALPAAPPTA